MMKRTSGILLHITSLPSKYGIGDLGPGAYRFADFLEASGQHLWQILPLTPTSTHLGNSPYSSYSAFAGNPLLISPEILIKEGFLKKSDVHLFPELSVNKIDYSVISRWKYRILNYVYKTHKEKISADKKFQAFCHRENDWLDDHSFFVSLKAHFNEVSWNQWPEDLKDRKKGHLEKWKISLKEPMQREKFFQYLFSQQWNALRKYCHHKAIKFIGDCPIYVNYDSVDVWANTHLFKLDADKNPTVVAGVPPDYFSKTGQRWGNPIYRWDVLKKERYEWWGKRLEHHFQKFDCIRLDHFRGFVDYWEIEAKEKTAINGKWVKAPAEDFLTTMQGRFKKFPIIAEDLGIITDDVRDIIHRFNFPGMRVLMFAFGDDPQHNPHWIANHSKNCIIYTGTHDNNTVKGWWDKDAHQSEKKYLQQCLDKEILEDQIHWEFINLTMASVADWVIMPIQDILGLGGEARMNRPGRAKGNWRWRCDEKVLNFKLSQKLSKMTQAHGR